MRPKTTSAMPGQAGMARLHEAQSRDTANTPPLTAVTAGAAAGAFAPALAGAASIGGVSAGTLASVATYASLAAPSASISGARRALS